MGPNFGAEISTSILFLCFVSLPARVVSLTVLIGNRAPLNMGNILVVRMASWMGCLIPRHDEFGDFLFCVCLFLCVFLFLETSQDEAISVFFVRFCFLICFNQEIVQKP